MKHASSSVTISIYDVFGNPVKKIENASGRKGLNEAKWDGKNGKGRIVASGAYLCVIKTDNGKAIRKIGVVK